MKELHAEGLAIHGGPESWADGPRGLRPSVDRGTRKPGIEPRNHQSEVPTPSSRAEGNMWRDAMRVPSRPLAVQDPERAWNLSAREPGDPSTAHGWHRGPQRGSARSAESLR
jgi:hypothetical protein